MRVSKAISLYFNLLASIGGLASQQFIVLTIVHSWYSLTNQRRDGFIDLPRFCGGCVSLYSWSSWDFKIPPPGPGLCLLLCFVSNQNMSLRVYRVVLLQSNCTVSRLISPASFGYTFSVEISKVGGAFTDYGIDRLRPWKSEGLPLNNSFVISVSIVGSSNTL